MKLTIEGIGNITSATIELVGLTVIAGQNDTGKSTLGKVAFALVQAFSTFPIVIKKKKTAQLRRQLDALYIEVRRNYDLTDHPEIRHFFSSLRLHSRDANDIPFGQIDYYIDQLNDSNKDSQQLLFTNGLKRIDSIRNRLNGIRLGLEKKLTNEEAIGQMVHQALKSEFSGKIQYSDAENPARIIITDGPTLVLDMIFDNHSVHHFTGGEPLGFRESTLVEGPAIMQFLPAILDEFGDGDFPDHEGYRGRIPYHHFDLANKLRASRGIGANETARSSGVCSVFNGQVFYDENQESFILKRGELEVPSSNIASGIKALSLVEILYRSDFIAEDTLLILDEPETNLHPSWQIAYAKAICELVESGARILVTTHSPYMLEALRGYSTSDSSTNFYLAQNTTNDSSRFIDVHGDISPIIKTLSQPLADLLKELNVDDF